MLDRIKRRRGQRTDVHVSSETPPLNTIARLLSELLAAIQGMVLPPTIHEMPYLADDGRATKAAHDIGILEPKASVDESSRNPKMPHQASIVKAVSELPELVGQRAYAILAALNAATLSVLYVASEPVKGWKATSWRTRVLLVVAFTLEAVFGARLAERLAGSSDYVSWAVGLAIATLLTASAMSIAYAIHTQQIGLLRGKGAWVGLGLAILAVAFLSAYAWGLGGGAEADTSGGGLTGGTATGDTGGTSGDTEDWALMVIYLGLLVLLLATVVLSHLLDLFYEQVERVDRDMALKDHVLSCDDQVVLAIKLLRQCLVLKDQAKHRARGILMSYVGGVRSTLSPDVNMAWTTDDLEHLDLPDPAWVAEIEAEIKRLERRARESGEDGDPPPPLSLAS